jgi:anti-anti-sigma regulatory factor/HAMP domain-containing protein
MKLSLGVKVNLVVVGVLGALLVAIVVLLNSSVDRLTAATGRQRVEQEVEVFQRQFDKAQREALSAAKLLATSPALVEALTSADPNRIRTAALVSGNRLGFKSVGLANKDGARIMTSASATAPEIAQEEQLLSLALLDIETMGVITAPDQPKLSLAVSVPMHDVSGRIIGALVASRVVDGAFLDAMNFSREHVDLILMNNGQLVAQSGPEQERTAATGERAAILDQTAIKQALAGQVVIADDLINIAGAPHALAHVPLMVRKAPAGVVGILVDVGELVAFQKQLTSSLAFIFTLLALAAIGMMALFVRQSVTAPLRKLRSAAARLASGDYQQRATITTKDEIGQLAQAFNTTAGAVQEREIALQRLAASLEQQVEERTGELRRRAEEQTRLQEQIIRMQAAALAELSTPLIPITDQIVVMPLIGALDRQRANQILSTLLHGIEVSRSRVAILDITGVPVVDTHVAQTLMRVAQAIRLLGAQAMITGIRPEVAQTLVGLGVDLQGIITHSVLQNGIAYALRSLTEQQQVGP